MRIPATRAREGVGLCQGGSAQRRPGCESRRHLEDPAQVHPVPSALNEGRGANPGDTPAPACQHLLTARRSTKAGVRIPATHPETRAPGVPRRSLNEGRGANPGDTPRCTRRRSPTCSLNEGRGANPGDTFWMSRTAAEFSDAQRRPGCESRRHLVLVVRVSVPRALNEGRGANPGDTIRDSANAPASGLAQRRPGCESRRHEL